MMNSTIQDTSDLLARQKALNPHHSYIVQAPAGSGKTELITQRFLQLLARVEHPESIIALTFTKKAAREMRDRILSAIEKVHRNEKNAQPKTDKLAKMVLIQDKKQGWQLLQTPNRIRVQTIDALCSNLVLKMPILSQGVPYASITEDPNTCYKEAAERCLVEGQYDPTYQKAIQVLLLHLGNHFGRAIQLLADMLSWREQWLPHLIPTQALSPFQLRKKLESALQHLTHEARNQLEALFSNEVKEELAILLAFSKTIIQDNKTEFWKKVGNLLLTKDNTWRSRVDKNLGFPSPSDAKNPDEKNFLKEMKSRLDNLLSYWRENSRESEHYRLALENYRRCPSETYSEDQWEMLQALIILLPLLAAQLKTIFMETGQTDFSEIAEQASLALGELGNPSDLALYLDYSIQHILIDEFQDTSLKQFCLLEKLIDGWQEGDGRTLFIVGDPMQSIYRFREADVSLFLKIRHYGIGQIFPRFLMLNSNFRSRPELIEWVNTCFHSIFPSQDDMHLSAISHHASQAGRQEYISAGEIHFCLSEDKEQHAFQIIEKIKSIPANESVAILVRSRSQLKQLLPYLQQAGIPFQGVDIDSLSTRPYIQDLLSLTQTLLQPANQLAWLSVLRAPWCGMKLVDLFAIVRCQGNFDGTLSADGQARFQVVESIIQQARQQRQRQPIALWVESTWRKLGGHLTINSTEQADIEKFLTLLDNYTHESFDIIQDLSEKVSSLYSNTPQESRLHIMTIHRSKGLEFDHVILPHLESLPGKKDYPLLQHLEHRTITAENKLILAVIKSVETQQDDIYRYLQYVNDKKEIFERQRLLYVALTRARTHIHLFAVQTAHSTHSFLGWLTPYLPESSSAKNGTISTGKQEIDSTQTYLTRLNSTFFENFYKSSSSLKAVPYFQQEARTDNSLSLIGTFIHEQIQYCAENHLSHSSQIETHQWKNRLIELGLCKDEEQQKAFILTQQALSNLYQDPQGQWILNKSHLQAKNEYALSYLDPADNMLKNIILDRTFIDPSENKRWIIDYKTSQEPLPIGAIALEFAPQHYRIQLEHYAKILSLFLKNHPHQSDQYPIYLGLYYPLTQTWIAWPYLPMLQ